MSRRLKLSLIALAGLVVLVAGLLWALPEIVRRVALDQIPKRTGRAAAIGDVDLNLFTGRLAIKAFRLAEREGPEPFVAFERLDVKLSPLALLRSHVHVVEVALAAPSVRLVRTGPAEFNFSDLLGGTKTPETPPTPGRWTVTVERARISGGRVEATDRAVTPAADWLIQDLGFEVAGLTTRPGAPPGRLTLRLRLNDTSVSLDAAPLRLEPLQFHAKLATDSAGSTRTSSSHRAHLTGRGGAGSPWLWSATSTAAPRGFRRRRSPGSSASKATAWSR